MVNYRMLKENDFVIIYVSSAYNLTRGAKMLKLLLELILLPFRIIFEKIRTAVKEFIYRKATKTDFIKAEIQGYYDGNHIYLTSAEPKNLEYIRKIKVDKDELISEREGDKLKIKYETTQTSVLPLNYEYKSQTKTKMLLYKSNTNI